MTDLVLVRYDLGNEYEIAPRGRVFAEVHGLDVLDEPAVGRDGRVKKAQRIRKRTGRKAKPQTTVSDETAKKKAAPKKAPPAEPDEKVESE